MVQQPNVSRKRIANMGRSTARRCRKRLIQCSIDALSKRSTVPIGFEIQPDARC